MTERVVWVADAGRHSALVRLLSEACRGVAELRPRRAGGAENGLLLELGGCDTPEWRGEVWRFIDAAGRPLFVAWSQSAAWQRPPYVAPVRLIRHREQSPDGREDVWRPGGAVLDEAFICSRRSWRGFTRHRALTAGRLLRRALIAADPLPWFEPPEPAIGNDGLRALAAGALRRARSLSLAALSTDEWRIGIVEAPIAAMLSADPPKATWFENPSRGSYLADPFPLPGTGHIVCEEFPFLTHRGRLVVVRLTQRSSTIDHVLMAERTTHLSYPFVLEEAGEVHLIVETADRGEAVIRRLGPGGMEAVSSPICRGGRPVDATLFRMGKRWWAAWTDLALGENDNLCLAHAPVLDGPWTPHPLNPVKIDIRSSRPAGTPFWHQGELYRPAQDCAASYGSAIIINRITVLSETAFREVAVQRLAPDPDGPVPHGMHTITARDTTTLVDGKRRVFRATAFAGRAASLWRAWMRRRRRHSG
jgi:hypothetical protein